MKSFASTLAICAALILMSVSSKAQALSDEDADLLYHLTGKNDGSIVEETKDYIASRFGPMTEWKCVKGINYQGKNDESSWWSPKRRAYVFKGLRCDVWESIDLERNVVCYKHKSYIGGCVPLSPIK
jgi:hypothetical protein